MMKKIWEFRLLSSKFGKWWLLMFMSYLFMNIVVIIPVSWFVDDVNIMNAGTLGIFLMLVPVLPFLFISCLKFIVELFREATE